MKKLLVCVMALCLALNMAGCDAVQKKFTRKKKAEPKKPKIYQLKKYEKKPTPELYNKHYVYWESWSSELIQVLGQNRKKDRQCIEQMVSQLRDMKNILVKEKADALQAHIDRAEEVRATIERGDMSYATKASVRSTLEREDRAIKREFITSEIKNYIKESFEEEAPAAQMTQVGEPATGEAPEK